MAELVTAAGAVVTAIVAGLFSVLVQRTRRENNTAHDANMRVLSSIDTRTERMDEKLDEHGEWIAGHSAWHKGRGDDPA